MCFTCAAFAKPILFAGLFPAACVLSTEVVLGAYSSVGLSQVTVYHVKQKRAARLGPNAALGPRAFR